MKGRILVVEDNLITAEVISQGVKKLGHLVAGAVTTGEEAVAWVAENQADLVLMDIHLDGTMDGIEAAAAMRQYSDVPIVYLTANSDSQTVDRASDTRASGYLHKPFDERGLHSAIQMALGRHVADSNTTGTCERLERTLAALSDAIIVADAVGSVASMNPAAEEITGWPAEEACGKDIAEVLTALDQNGHNEAVTLADRLLADQLSALQGTVTVVARNGKSRTMHQNASPMTDKRQRLTGVVLALRAAPETTNCRNHKPGPQ